MFLLHTVFIYKCFSVDLFRNVVNNEPFIRLEETIRLMKGEGRTEKHQCIINYSTFMWSGKTLFPIVCARKWPMTTKIWLTGSHQNTVVHTLFICRLLHHSLLNSVCKWSRLHLISKRLLIDVILILFTETKWINTYWVKKKMRRVSLCSLA